MGKAFAFDIGEQFKFGEKTLGKCENVQIPTSNEPVRVCSGLFPTLGNLISTILPSIYILAGLILFILLLFGGFGIIMGAQGGNPEQVGKGKNAVGAALAGFFLIFASYWIIQIIEKLTGIDILNTTF